MCSMIWVYLIDITCRSHVWDTGKRCKCKSLGLPEQAKPAMFRCCFNMFQPVDTMKCNSWLNIEVEQINLVRLQFSPTHPYPTPTFVSIFWPEHVGFCCTELHGVALLGNRLEFGHLESLVLVGQVVLTILVQKCMFWHSWQGHQEFSLYCSIYIYGYK